MVDLPRYKRIFQVKQVLPSFQRLGWLKLILKERVFNGYSRSSIHNESEKRTAASVGCTILELCHVFPNPPAGDSVTFGGLCVVIACCLAKNTCLLFAKNVNHAR